MKIFDLLKPYTPYPIEVDPVCHYKCAEELFADPKFTRYLQRFWPIFVARANDLCLQNGKLGQEVGKMRERVILYLFYRYLGEDAENCALNDQTVSVNEKGKDTLLFGRDVSIKTISATGNQFHQLKISWIEDKIMADEIARTWVPQFDLLLCRLKWNCKTEGFYYIPKDAQQEVISQEANALKTSGGYGKGTSLSKKACESLVSHPKTLKIPIAMPPEYRDENFLPRLLDRIYYEIKKGRDLDRYRMLA